MNSACAIVVGLYAEAGAPLASQVPGLLTICEGGTSSGISCAPPGPVEDRLLRSAESPTSNEVAALADASDASAGISAIGVKSGTGGAVGSSALPIAHSVSTSRA